MRMYDLDVAATHWINNAAGHRALIDLPMMWISAAGVPLLILAVAAQWWAKADRRHTRHVLVATGFSFLLGLAFNQMILFFVHRLRPYDSGVTHLLTERSADFSFPSDHTTAVFAIAASFLLHAMPRRGFVFTAAAAIVAISRVYIGTHYVSDILGGALTGIMAAVLVRLFYWHGTRADRFVTGIL